MKKKIIAGVVSLVSLIAVIGISGFFYVRSQFKLSQSDVEKIVYKNAGVTSSDIKSKVFHKEFDDLKAVYEISFTTSSTEYEYLVDAKTGSILEYDTESFVDLTASSTSSETSKSSETSSQSSTSSTQVTMEQAKQTVLKELNLNESDTQFLVVETDTDNGKTYYQVEFQVPSKGLEYDYKVDSETGAIVERNQESIND